MLFCWPRDTGLWNLEVGYRWVSVQRGWFTLALGLAAAFLWVQFGIQ